MIARTLHAFKSLLTAGRTSFAAAAACVIAGVLVTGCGSSVSPPPLASEPIRIASYVWPGSFWVDVAHDKGWFREAGLNVERVDVNGKYFQSMLDVNSGKLHAMGFSQYDLMRHVAAGNDLVGIIAIDYSETADALVAKPGIRRLQDLRGRKIALPRGTYLEYLLSVVAQRDDLDLKDITLVDRTGDEAIADFAAGRVDAILSWEPYVSYAKTAGGTQIFCAGDFPGLTYSVFTLRRDYIDAHPREVNALVQVWQRAERFIRENPRESSEIVSRVSHETLPYVEGLLSSDRVLDISDNRRAFSYAAGFESLHGSWRRMNDFMLDRDLVSRRVDSPAHLDSRFIRALQ